MARHSRTGCNADMTIRLTVIERMIKIITSWVPAITYKSNIYGDKKEVNLRHLFYIKIHHHKFTSLSCFVKRREMSPW